MYIDWIPCMDGQMPEDEKRNADKTIINCLVTTERGNVTKVQRRFWRNYSGDGGVWAWTRIQDEVIAWVPLPYPYKKTKDIKNMQSDGKHGAHLPSNNSFQKEGKAL